MDEVFQGLAGLVRGISRGQNTREIPRSSPASSKKTPSLQTLLLNLHSILNSLSSVQNRDKMKSRNFFCRAYLNQLFTIIICWNNFLFVKKCSLFFSRRTHTNSHNKAPVLAPLQVHIGAWCIRRFYVKNFERS